MNADSKGFFCYWAISLFCHLADTKNPAIVVLDTVVKFLKLGINKMKL
jgi:hypothetical protein